MTKTGDFFDELGVDFARDIPHVRMALVAGANRFAFRLFAGSMRRHGPGELLPLTQHLLETHILLRDGANGECGIELEIAAMLHDIFEVYSEENGQAIERRLYAKLRKFGKRLVEGVEEHLARQLDIEYREAFIDTLVSDVFMLIQGVTEIARVNGSSTWEERKLPYLEGIRTGERRLAMLSCATKSSGLVSALRYHKKGLDTDQWSAGTHDQNVWFHGSLLEIYREKKIPRGLLTYFEIVFKEFRHNGMCRVERS